jgi:hypothetical protein
MHEPFQYCLRFRGGFLEARRRFCHGEVACLLERREHEQVIESERVPGLAFLDEQADKPDIGLATGQDQGDGALGAARIGTFFSTPVCL